MDSGNSTGSLQSSSGGDDESYDSRADFFNYHPNPPSHHHHHLASSTHSNPPPPFGGFDPPSNYLNPIQTSNFDMVWSRPARSDPNPSDLGGFNPPSSSNQPFFSGQLAGQPLVPESSSRGLVSISGGGGSGGNIDQSGGGGGNNNNNVGRNPKKRSRASRRAPTTVLTTDTTNFRAMVQEFTGIPAPPFVSSPFQRSRLDLLGSHATAIRTPTPPTYNLLRPFAQKPSQSYHLPFLSSSLPAFPSTAVDPLLASSTNNSNPILFPSFSQPSLNFNLHNNNPVLNFPSSTQAPLGISPAGVGHNTSQLKMGGGIEEFGLNHQNLVSSSSEWLERTGTNNNNGGGSLEMAPSSSDFHIEKAAAAPATTSENVAAAARSEGMVESWINCSTD